MDKMKLGDLRLGSPTRHAEEKAIVGEVGLLPRAPAKNVIHHFTTVGVVGTEGVLHWEQGCRRNMPYHELFENAYLEHNIHLVLGAPR